MKTIILILMLCACCTQTMLGNPPKKIYTLARQNFSINYYQEQIKEWKQVLNQNSKNADAWLNYYLANHNVWQKGGKVTYPETQKIVKDAASKIPNSFEYNYIYYYNSLNKTRDFEYLQKAFELAPDRYETYKEFIQHYELKGDQKQVEKFCEKWLNSGEYSTGIFNWNYNVLAGLEKDAVLITQGENDTYPIWILQYAKVVRKDVRVLNIQLLKNKTYQQRLFEELGIPAFELDYAQAQNESQFFNSMVSHILQNLSNKTAYLGVSIPKGVVNNYEEELYIVGLAFQYSQQLLDNVELIETNYENKFFLDYLNINFHQDLSQEIVEQYNLNYLPAFLILHKHYQGKGEYNKASHLKDLIVNIAKQGGKQKEIEEYLKQAQPVPPGDQPAVFYKQLHTLAYPFPAGLKTLYMNYTEITNMQYELFIKDLLRRKQYKLLERYGSQVVDWRSYLSSEQKDIADVDLYKHGKPEKLNMPVQNISYEAAQAYCEWYTNTYNAIQDKKKAYGQKIIARLPTEREWMLAAIGQPLAGTGELFEPNSKYKYPWYGSIGYKPTVKNDKGCFLININTADEEPCATCPVDDYAALDGGFFPVPADSYFPNNFGLYNMAGNVAEMVAEKGLAKGGSWYHTEKEATIQAQQHYEKAEPYIGFRIVIEKLDDQSELVHKAHTGPPNTRWLTGNLWMDETEINNISWFEYLYWLKTNKPERYERMKQDTLVWNYTYNKPFVNTYHNHPAYRTYPVVGVSHEQATAYCKWRTGVVNEMIGLKPRLLKKYGKVHFRLPTEKEWEYAAHSGTHGGFQGVTNIKKDTIETSTITAPDYSYVANDWNYYHMLGNVAEMIQEKGIAKGGSWQHPKEESQVTSRNRYDKPTNWLGFRCICETEKIPD
ncbi:MAG: SUMF1/EgtB/PvdO family nonheme iron enzyme [Aureispira sp.]|nr:SUMF1/EgtB/PvdO family nonheme iron enzyme [Aureispira sp.]